MRIEEIKLLTESKAMMIDVTKLTKAQMIKLIAEMKTANPNQFTVEFGRSTTEAMLKKVIVDCKYSEWDANKFEHVYLIDVNHEALRNLGGDPAGFYGSATTLQHKVTIHLTKTGGLGVSVRKGNKIKN
jgi:tartrate dehydratase alpha subunit/fumarate hydratase class I-like protein